jgi:hypothetical protein
MPELYNPHDHPSAALRVSFFRATFAQRDVAAGFARHYLPSVVVEPLNLEILQPAKDSFVDDELCDHFHPFLEQAWPHISECAP